MGSVSGVRRLKTFQHYRRFLAISVIFISGKVDLAPSFSLWDLTQSSLTSPRTQISKTLPLNEFIRNSNPWKFLMRLSQWFIRKSRSWMFAGQMNLDTIDSSFGDCHTLKYFHFTADFLRPSRRDCQLVHPQLSSAFFEEESKLPALYCSILSSH